MSRNLPPILTAIVLVALLTAGLRLGASAQDATPSPTLQIATAEVGINGNSYVDPAHGWRVSWDGWTPTTVARSLVLTTGAIDGAIGAWDPSDSLVAAGWLNLDDPNSCLALWTRTGVWGVQPALGSDGQPLRGGDDDHAWGVFTADASVLSGLLGTFSVDPPVAFYHGCWRLEAGGALLDVRFETAAASFNDQAAQIQRVVDALTLPPPGSWTPQPRSGASPAPAGPVLDQLPIPSLRDGRCGGGGPERVALAPFQANEGPDAIPGSATSRTTSAEELALGSGLAIALASPQAPDEPLWACANVAGIPAGGSVRVRLEPYAESAYTTFATLGQTAGETQVAIDLIPNGVWVPGGLVSGSPSPPATEPADDGEGAVPACEIDATLVRRLREEAASLRAQADEARAAADTSSDATELRALARRLDALVRDQEQLADKLEQACPQ